MEKQFLSPEQHNEFLNTIKTRFEENTSRHRGLTWAEVQARLEAAPEKLAVLLEMEETGGEPDVVVLGEPTDGYLFHGLLGGESQRPPQPVLRPHRLASPKSQQTGKYRAGRSGRHGHRTADGGAVPRTAAVGRIRHQNFQLVENAG